MAHLDETKLTTFDQKINLQLRSGPLDRKSLYVLDLWKTNPEPILFDPIVDALLKLDGFAVLAPGWVPYGEAWGNWSEGGAASPMLLPIPAGKPKSLNLQARTFVHEKHSKLDVEILINGVLQKKVSLTEIESNQIDIPLPASLLGRDYFKLELKILNPTNPKALEIGKDDHQLGLGAISAVFE